MSTEILFDAQDAERLEDAQKLRLKIIEDITKNGLPDDKSDRDFLLETLKDVDKSIYTKTRIKVSSKAVDQQKDTTLIIAELLKRHTVGANIGEGVIPILDSKHQVEDIVDGETKIGIETLTYESFIAE